MCSQSLIGTKHPCLVEQHILPLIPSRVAIRGHFSGAMSALRACAARCVLRAFERVRDRCMMGEMLQHAPSRERPDVASEAALLPARVAWHASHLLAVLGPKTSDLAQAARPCSTPKTREVAAQRQDRTGHKQRVAGG